MVSIDKRHTCTTIDDADKHICVQACPRQPFTEKQKQTTIKDATPVRVDGMKSIVYNIKHCNSGMALEATPMLKQSAFHSIYSARTWTTYYITEGLYDHESDATVQALNRRPTTVNNIADTRSRGSDEKHKYLKWTLQMIEKATIMNVPISAKRYDSDATR